MGNALPQKKQQQKILSACVYVYMRTHLHSLTVCPVFFFSLLGVCTSPPQPDQQTSSITCCDYKTQMAIIQCALGYHQRICK